MVTGHSFMIKMKHKQDFLSREARPHTNKIHRNAVDEKFEVCTPCRPAADQQFETCTGRRFAGCRQVASYAE